MSALRPLAAVLALSAISCSSTTIAPTADGGGDTIGGGTGGGCSCAVGEICVQGNCFPSVCGDEACPAGEFCASGSCVQVACYGVECPGNQYCDGGRCFSEGIAAAATGASAASSTAGGSLGTSSATGTSGVAASGTSGAAASSTSGGGSCPTPEPACTPPKTSAASCGNCGTVALACTADCTWTDAGECTGQGVCAPDGSPSKRGCNAGIWDAGIQTLSCGATTCQWVASACTACSPDGDLVFPTSTVTADPVSCCAGQAPTECILDTGRGGIIRYYCLAAGATCP